jgi:serine/threonine protein kinase/tetratricopeptide (TPR) repeat protein
MRCPQCHTANPSDSRFCWNCATPLPYDETLSRALEEPVVLDQELKEGIIFAKKYQIIEKLGGGGMGVVYKAADLKLKRLVALKFLPLSFSSHQEANLRFIQEAQAASVLDHQNICTIYEVDQSDRGQMYIVMAYYEGETLKKKIERGPLPVDHAVEFMIQVAEGLFKAHSKGIIHRDIKPANVIVTTDGIAKIIDFGLAKLARQVGLTKTSTVVGTVAYMSPEQALGENVDQRTDLWSLGVLFFELLTAEAPFKGENDQAAIYSIINKLPLAATELREDIPEEAEHIIFKCLMKKQEDRYQSADQLLSDLVKLKRRLAAGTAEGREEGDKEPALKKETERRRASVMSAATVQYSKMLELMETEEALLTLNRFYALIDSIIKKYGGWIEKITGGSFIALFGIPKAIEDAPKKAINAAIELRNSLDRFNKKENLKIPLDIHIGIDTGMVIAGTFGVGAKTEYSVMGDAVNIASLLRDISEKGQIYVGPQTHRSTKDEFDYEPLKAVVPEGSKSIIPVFRLLSIVERVYRPGLGSERMIYSEMVGRDKELSKLEFHLLKAIHHEGSILNIIGEAGIGKSRLIAEFKRKDAVQKAIFLEGRALSIGKNLSFHPIIDIIKNWAAIKDDINKPENIQKLKDAIQEIDPEGAEEKFPFIGTLTGMKLPAKYAERLKGIEGEALEKLILKSLKELIIKAANRRALVFIIEDLHWADMSSVRLLESLFRLAESQSILFINVFRPAYEATSERLRRTIRNRYGDFCADIILESLKENEAEALINNLLKMKAIPASMKELITARAEGNPFFIEEVVRSFIDDGVVVLKDGVFRMTQKIDHVVIPQTINELLMARIDKLDEETRSLLKVASVIGRSFFYKILREVVKTTEEIDDRLAYLKEIQLLKEQERLDEIEYLFKHALAQEAVYNSILLKKRREIHLQVAHSIESVFHERLPEFYGMLAFHFSLGEDLDKAEEYLIRCGEEALKSSASSEALYYYQEALKIYLAKHGAAADREKIAMLEKNIAIAFFNKGQYNEAVEYFDKAGAYYKQKLPKHRATTVIKFLLGFFNLLRCLYLPALTRIRNPTPTDKEIIGLYEKKSRALSIINPRRFFIESFYWIKRLIRSNLKEVEGGAGIYAMTSALFCYSGLSMRLSLKILKHIEKRVDLNDSKSLICARFAKLMHCYLAGDWDEVEEFDDHLLNLNLRIGEIFDTSNYLLFHGYIRLEQASLEATQKFEDRLLEISNTFEDDYSKSMKYFLKAKSLFKYRKLDECLAESDRGIAILDKLGYGALSLSLYSYKARIKMWLGNSAEAERLLEEAERIQFKYNPVPIYKSQYCLSQFSLAIHRMNQFKKSGNIHQYRKLCQTTAKAGRNMMRNAYKVAADIPEAERLMGVFCWLKGQQKKALNCWKKSIEEAEARGARLELARTSMEIGARLLEKNNRFHQLNRLRPQQYLEKAKSLFGEMGLQWDLEEMEKMAFK